MSYSDEVINQLIAKVDMLERQLASINTIDVANNFCHIETQSIASGSSAQYIDFTDIPDYYTDIRFMIYGYNTNVASRSLYAIFNNNTSARYSYNYTGFVTSTAATGVIVSGATSAEIGRFRGTGDLASIPSIVDFTIYDYANPITKPIWISKGSTWHTNATVTYRHYTGVHYPADPYILNQVTFSVNNGSYYFNYPTVISLYGVKI